MKRRNLLLGAGALVFGSGALSANAAFNDSVEPSADMRVVAEQDVIVQAGQAFNDDGSVRSGYQNDYVEFNDGSGDIDFFEDAGLSNSNPEGLVDINPSDLPVATVNKRSQYTDSDVEMQVAFLNDAFYPSKSTPDKYQYRFEDILEILNQTGSDLEIGIGYDRNDSGFDPNGMYGVDVNLSGSSSGIVPQIVQHIFEFRGKDPKGTFTDKRISPDSSDSDDFPPSADFATVRAGDKINVDLKIDLSDFGLTNVRTRIDDAAELNSNSNPFDGGGIDTVDMLDGIDVGTP